MAEKTATEKESTLIKIIEAANKKLSKLHNKQKIRNSRRKGATKPIQIEKKLPQHEDLQRGHVD